MPKSPPPLPGKTLARVLALSRANAWSVTAVAGLSTVAALAQAHWATAGFGVLATLAGLLELRGQARLRRDDARGLRGMIGAQFLLLAVGWAYAWFRWRHFDADALWSELPAFSQAQVTSQMQAADLDPEIDRPLLLRLMNIIVCVTLVLVTFVYQGGLALYYAAKSGVIRAALASSPVHSEPHRP